MKKPNKKDRKYYDNFIMMNGRQDNRFVPNKYIKDLEKYIKYLESKVNNSVLDAVIKCDHRFDRIDEKRIQCIKCDQIEHRL